MTDIVHLQEERRLILEVLSSKMVLQSDVNLDDVADRCQFFTGADFKALLYNAQLQVCSPTYRSVTGLVHFAECLLCFLGCCVVFYLFCLC